MWVRQSRIEVCIWMCVFYYSNNDETRTCLEKARRQTKEELDLTKKDFLYQCKSYIPKPGET